MQMTFDLLLSLLGMAVVAQYAWSVRKHFASTKVPTGTMVISIVVVASLAVYLLLQWMFEQPVLAQIVGLLAMAASLVLFWAAIFASREARLLLAFDEKKPHGLVSIGPYRYVRHPFYLSYLMFWTGWAVALWTAWALVPLAVIYLIYLVAARGEERKFDTSPLAEDYRRYREQAGFLWPKFSGRA